MTTTQTCHFHETLRLCSEMHHLSCMTYHFHANHNGIAAQTDTWHVHEKSLFGALPNSRAIGAGFEHLRTVADGCGRLRTVANTKTTTGEHSSTLRLPKLNENFFFFTQHAVVKARKAFFSERWEATKADKKSKVCTDWALPESASCTSLRIAVQSWKSELPLQRNTTLRKNLPEALTAIFSPSRTASRAPQGSSIWFDHCRHWGGVAIVALVCGLFFFFGANHRGNDKRRSR